MGANPRKTSPEALVSKIIALPVERIAEVEDFVDLIAREEQDRSLTCAAKAARNATFATVWTNPEDDVYDAI